MYNVVLVRYGEIAVKSEKVRRRMEKVLLSNIIFKIKSSGLNEFKIKRERGRIFVVTNKAEEVASLLTKIFGIVSVSPAIEVDNSIENIVRYSLSLAKVNVGSATKFAVRARRVKSYKLTSKDIERVVGEALLKNIPNLRVNLDSPDYTLYIEVRERNAYLFDKVLKGVGGLPYGVEGKVVALVSGGVDSAVASWLMMKRGCEVIPVHYDMQEYYSPEAKDRAMKVIKWLREWVPRKRFKAYWVPLGAAHRALKGIRSRYRCLICKSLMYRTAELICQIEGCKAIVTGESIGQVASQTLDNLYYLSGVTSMPIIRPVIGLDKEEIIDIARHLNVFKIAGKDVGKCKLVPKYPVTHITNKANEYLNKLNLDEIVETIFQEAKVLEL